MSLVTFRQFIESGKWGTLDPEFVEFTNVSDSATSTCDMHAIIVP